MAKILLVEDDLDLCRRIQKWLSFEYHQVHVINDGGDALEYLLSSKYDLVILDWQLPGLTGIDVLKAYRSKGGDTLVLMLTGRTTLQDKQAGLDQGADDYLPKPFDIEELAARVRALLRRLGGRPKEPLAYGNITLNQETHTVSVGGESVDLLPMEFTLLEFLISNPETVFTPDALLEKVWGGETEASIQVVRTYVHTLRKKLSTSHPETFIKTVHGVGYRLTCVD